jgi:ABC-type lipoprotein export system ATPase subunit
MLVARNIHKVYQAGNKEIAVLKGVDLTIAQGDFVAIVGPSGAGKSTLLHILGGLDAPSKGEVVFDDQSLYQLSDVALARVRNRAVGFVFQFYHLLSEFTVVENVCMPAVIKGGGVHDSGEAIKILEKVGLGERLTHFPSQLSGGERQRVALARALMNSPAMLLCDEPTGNLDSLSGKGIVDLLRSVNQQAKATVVLVTHNADIASSADKTYRLEDGKLV